MLVPPYGIGTQGVATNLGVVHPAPQERSVIEPRGPEMQLAGTHSSNHPGSSAPVHEPAASAARSGKAIWIPEKLLKGLRCLDGVDRLDRTEEHSGPVLGETSSYWLLVICHGEEHRRYPDAAQLVRRRSGSRQRRIATDEDAGDVVTALERDRLHFERYERVSHTRDERAGGRARVSTERDGDAAPVSPRRFRAPGHGGPELTAKKGELRTAKHRGVRRGTVIGTRFRTHILVDHEVGGVNADCLVIVDDDDSAGIATSRLLIGFGDGIAVKRHPIPAINWFRGHLESDLGAPPLPLWRKARR